MWPEKWRKLVHSGRKWSRHSKGHSHEEQEQPALSSFPGQWTFSAKLKKVPGKLGWVGHLMKNSWNPALFLYLILGEILLLIYILLIRVSVVLHYFANKGPSSQGYGFSSGHIWMWELDCEEGWAPKNGCFWTGVLEKTLESPLACKETQPVHSEGDQPWDFFGSNDAKAETPVLWPPHAKSWLISDAGMDLGQEKKGMTEGGMAGWPHQLDGHEFEWTPGVGDGQGGPACCDSWGHKESDSTEWLNWTELNWKLLQVCPTLCNTMDYSPPGSSVHGIL